MPVDVCNSVVFSTLKVVQLLEECVFPVSEKGYGPAYQEAMVYILKAPFYIVLFCKDLGHLCIPSLECISFIIESSNTITYGGIETNVSITLIPMRVGLYLSSYP